MESGKPIIMIVDDSIASLRICKSALANDYDVMTVPSAEKMLARLEREKPDLILLDIEMPEMNGYEAIVILKNDSKLCDIPVIFLTGNSDKEDEIKGLSLGAVDFISKPIMKPLLLKRIEVHLMVEEQKRILEAQAKTLESQALELRNFNNNLQKMVEEKTKEVMELQGAILKTMVELIESHDNATGGHVERTQLGIELLVNEMRNLGLYTEDMSKWDIKMLVLSSQLHDVGKVAISDTILNKPGKLTKEEFTEIKKHASIGVEIIEKIEASTSGSDFLEHAKIFAASHHERWDGTGYPSGLSGQDIPLQGRLMAIVDVYDALISERPYKSAYEHEEAMRIIIEGRGSHFDPALVEVFERVADKFAPENNPNQERALG